MSVQHYRRRSRRKKPAISPAEALRLRTKRLLNAAAKAARRYYEEIDY